MSDFKMAQPRPMYDPEAVKPMREELKVVGVKELLTAEAVDEALAQKGTALVVINSVCGCAAGSARPGVMMALQNKVIPDQLTTVFAGMEREATEQARGHMTDVPPSSPCIGLFKDGEIVHVLPRWEIENRSAQQVAALLVEGFNKFCTAEGPSIPPEEFAKIVPFQACGSSIPLAPPS